MSGKSLPKGFVDYIFTKRVEALRKFMNGELEGSDFLIEFTRATPVVITQGPAGLSGSVKMIGFVPHKKYLNEFTLKAEKYAYVKRPSSMREIIEVLLKEFYIRECLNLSVLGGLEMGFKHSWVNIKATRSATLLYYTPPNESFEVRCDVEIYESGLVKRYLNALHDIFHGSVKLGKKSNYPAYIFKIKEIYNNSNSPLGFGRKIL